MTIRSAAVVGTGAVGSALAKNLVEHGITVQITGRDAGKSRELALSLGKNAQAVDNKTVGKAVDAVFLAVPADAAASVLRESGGAGGAIIVDCTNPLTWDEGPVHAPPHEGSVAAQLVHQFPSARVVKAWNTFGAEFHANPKLGASKVDVYLASDDAEAKKALAELATTLGFEPVDVGPLRNARHLESLAILWIHLATVGGRGRDVAFKLLPR